MREQATGIRQQSNSYLTVACCLFTVVSNPTEGRVNLQSIIELMDAALPCPVYARGHPLGEECALYNFNTTQSKYRGTGAGAEAKARM